MTELFKRLGEIVSDTVEQRVPYIHSPELTELGNKEAETEHYVKLGRNIIYKTLVALEQHGYNTTRSCEPPMSHSYLEYLHYYEKVST